MKLNSSNIFNLFYFLILVIWVCIFSPINAKAQNTLIDSAASRVEDNDSLRVDSALINSDILELQEKTVQGSMSRTHLNKEVSRVRLTREELKKVVAAQGDPLKALTTLPGTSNQNDLSVRPFVRGGKSEETQVLWNGIPLLQPYHFGSIYSVFNIESLEDLTLYTGGFPVEIGNALSGALFMRSRPSPIDSLALSADLSLLRGNAYAGIPLVKNKLGISFAYQAFWYDWVFNRGMDLLGAFVSDPQFQKDKKQIENYVDLPNFKDTQLGLDWKINSEWSAEYTGIISKDIFKVKNLTTHDYVNGQEVSPNYYAWDLFFGKPTDKREKLQNVDTLALVDVDNSFHAITLHWQANEKWNLDQTIAYQGQDWHVGFYDNSIWIDSITPDEKFAGVRIDAPSTKILKLNNQTYDWRLDAKGYLTEKFCLRLGASYSKRESQFETNLPRPAFEIIVNGNPDALDAMGYYNPNGFVYRRGDPAVSVNTDYLTALTQLIHFNYAGNLATNYSAGYTSGEYNFDEKHRVTLGLRAEMDDYSVNPFLSPRFAYFQSLSKKDEFTFASGLYSQNDFAFNIRSANPNLQSEKAFHLNFEWTHSFSKLYRLEWQVYQKNYFDLVVPYLVNTRHLDWNSDILSNFDSTSFKALPKELQDSVIGRFGVRQLGYRNGGTGKAAGSEISFFYNPNSAVIQPPQIELGL